MLNLLTYVLLLPEVDGPIPDQLAGLFQITAALIVKLIAVVIYAPVFGLAAIAAAIAGIGTGQIYLKAQLPVKRHMSNAKAPIIGHFSACLSGLSESTSSTVPALVNS